MSGTGVSREILLLEELHPDARSLLAGAGQLVMGTDQTTTDGTVEFPRVEAILTRGRGRVTAELVARCPRLRVVARAGVGLDNIDRDALRARDIPLLSTPGANARTTAEHTIALLLALSRRIVPMSRAVADGRWEDRRHYDGDELDGKILGVVGFGAIGRRVAEVASALGMKILVADRAGLSTSFLRAPLRDVLGAADAVTVHVPLGPSTRGLLGAPELAAMKPGCLLVNTSRGEVVDQDAVLAALEAGRLGGFAADVLAVEPPPPSDPLLSHPLVLLTPHIASLTAGTFRTMCLIAAENVVGLLGGARLDGRWVAG